MGSPSAYMWPPDGSWSPKQKQKYPPKPSPSRKARIMTCWEAGSSWWQVSPGGGGMCYQGWFPIPQGQWAPGGCGFLCQGGFHRKGAGKEGQACGFSIDWATDQQKMPSFQTSNAISVRKDLLLCLLLVTLCPQEQCLHAICCGRMSKCWLNLWSLYFQPPSKCVPASQSVKKCCLLKNDSKRAFSNSYKRKVLTYPPRFLLESSHQLSC